MNTNLVRLALPAVAALSVPLLAFAATGQAAEPAPATTADAAAITAQAAPERNPLELPSLITATPEDGFRLALKLARLGVSQTQHDKTVLRAGRADYAQDSAQLIQASQTVAIHFQTVAQANNFWRDPAR